MRGPETFCKDLAHYSNLESDLAQLRRDVATETLKLKPQPRQVN